MSNSDLDATHLKILDALQRDASLTNVQLAERVNLSASPCLTRVRALEERGLIRQRVALLDPQKLGLNVNVFIHVSLERQARTGLDAFERAVCALPDVMECYLMTGDADYMIRAVLPDVQGVERLIVDEITRIPGVASIRTSFALKQVLYSTALPLRHLR